MPNDKYITSVRLGSKRATFRKYIWRTMTISSRFLSPDILFHPDHGPQFQEKVPHVILFSRSFYYYYCYYTVHVYILYFNIHTTGMITESWIMKVHGPIKSARRMYTIVREDALEQGRIGQFFRPAKWKNDENITKIYIFRNFAHRVIVMCVSTYVWGVFNKLKLNNVIRKKWFIIDRINV